jgi:Tfp pilus assembly protein PilV
MTLLEALTALVILGLTAVGFLGALQVATRSTHEAEVWTYAVSHAEAAMEETKLGIAAGQTGPLALAPGFARRIDVQPWEEGHGLQRVTVIVALPGGRSFTLQRLVRP